MATKTPEESTTWRAGTLFVLACCLGGLGCSNSITPKSGTLKCGTGSNACPNGYVCYAGDNFCYRPGELPLAGPDGGSGDVLGAADAKDGGAPPTGSDGGLSSADGLPRADGLPSADGLPPSNSDGRLTPGSDGSTSNPDVPSTSDLDARRPFDSAQLPPADAFVPVTYTPGPSGNALVPGGTTSSSSKYMVVRTAGQSPGGNRVRESTLYRFIGGVVGSTQK